MDRVYKLYHFENGFKLFLIFSPKTFSIFETSKPPNLSILGFFLVLQKEELGKNDFHSLICSC